MIRKAIFASVLALGACTQVPADNIAACSSALLGAGTSDPGKLLQIALATPACAGLAAEAINAIVNRLSTEQARRGVPR